MTATDHESNIVLASKEYDVIGIHDATGVRMDRLPMNPGAVLRAVQANGKK